MVVQNLGTVKRIEGFTTWIEKVGLDIGGDESNNESVSNTSWETGS